MCQENLKNSEIKNIPAKEKIKKYSPNQKFLNHLLKTKYSKIFISKKSRQVEVLSGKTFGGREIKHIPEDKFYKKFFVSFY